MNRILIILSIFSLITYTCASPAFNKNWPDPNKVIHISSSSSDSGDLVAMLEDGMEVDSGPKQIGDDSRSGQHEDQYSDDIDMEFVNMLEAELEVEGPKHSGDTSRSGENSTGLTLNRIVATTASTAAELFRSLKFQKNPQIATRFDAKMRVIAEERENMSNFIQEHLENQHVTIYKQEENSEKVWVRIGTNPAQNTPNGFTRDNLRLLRLLEAMDYLHRKAVETNLVTKAFQVNQVRDNHDKFIDWIFGEIFEPQQDRLPLLGTGERSGKCYETLFGEVQTYLGKYVDQDEKIRTHNHSILLADAALTLLGWWYQNIVASQTFSQDEFWNAMFGLLESIRTGHIVEARRAYRLPAQRRLQEKKLLQSGVNVPFSCK